MYRGKKVAVVVPAYCEERLLPRTLAGIPEYVDEVIVVDDGSPDGTYEVAQGSASQDGRVRVVRLGFNQGVGRAISVGYAHAVHEGAELVAVMAGDDQMDPDELDVVLDPLADGDADYVKGNRLAHPEARAMPPVRRLGTWALAKMTGWIAGWPELEDAQCGYTAITAEALEELPLDELYPSYGYPNDMLLRLSERGSRLAQPAVRPVYADEVSGFKVWQVAGPISGILLRGAWRRVRRA